MNRSLSFENAVVRHPARSFSPERLATLKTIFETVCDEAAIPPEASSDRDALAAKILLAVAHHILDHAIPHPHRDAASIIAIARARGLDERVGFGHGVPGWNYP